MRLYLSILPLCGFCSQALALDSSPFQSFDNNVLAGVAGNSSPGNYWASTLNASGQALFDNGVWLNLLVTTKLALNFSNNANSSISKTYNNSSGSSLDISGGYAFLFTEQYNVIPHIGFAYANQLLAVNENSIQQFIIENPSSNWSVGLKNEYIAIPSVLKFSLDLGFNYGDHQSVIPNSSDGSLGHYNYALYTLSFSPAVQWNLTERFTMIGYYQFNYNFSNDVNPPSISYPDIEVNTNQYLMTNYIQNTLGLSVGILF